MATDLPNWTIPTSIKDIAVPLPNANPNADGLQRAHLLRKTFWTDNLTWLDELLNDGTGFTQSLPLERFARDARIMRIYEGTSEIQRNIISPTVLTS